MKFTLVACTLNEIDGMRFVMPQIKREWLDQIIILDGGSKDGTIEYAKEQGYTVYVQKRKGIRRAYEEVWPMIEGDVVITFSPDGNCVSSLIPALIEKMKKGFDMVIVSRYLPPAVSTDDDLLTAFGNKMFTGMINLLHRGHYTDSMGIYRAYKKELPHKLRLMGEAPYEPMESWLGTVSSWEPLLSIRAAKYGLRCAEIAGDEPARVGGVRKLQIIKWGLTYMSQTVREFFL